MELMKKGMRTTYSLGDTMTQVALDDDFNVPDIKPDINKILKSIGEVQLDSVQNVDGKLLVSGKLLFKVLYATGQGAQAPVDCIKGELPIHETLYLPEESEHADVHIQTQIEDLSVGLINSRKISVNGIVTLMAEASVTQEEEPIVGLALDNTAQYLTKSVTAAAVLAEHRDTFRIKDEIELSANKPNISEMLWNEWQIGSIDFRPMEGKLGVRGDLRLFMLYSGEDENGSLQWSEHAIPFSGEIELDGCREDIYPYVRYRLASKDPEIKVNEDGEQRLLGIDEIIEMDITLFDEDTHKVMSDVYSSVMDLDPVLKDVRTQTLLTRNASKCRVTDKINIGEAQPRILQICNSSANVKIDNVSVVEGGLRADGAVVVSLLYIALDDKQPIYEAEGVIPFSHKIEVPGITEDCAYYLQGNVEQIGAVMLGSDEVECKVAILLDAMVFGVNNEKIITSIIERAYDMKKIHAMPGIVGYVVQPGDTLWKIAKQFYTTVESIKEINELTDDRLKPGDRLVIMKKLKDL